MILTELLYSYQIVSHLIKQEFVILDILGKND